MQEDVRLGIQTPNGIQWKGFVVVLIQQSSQTVCKIWEEKKFNNSCEQELGKGKKIWYKLSSEKIQCMEIECIQDS